MKYKSAMLIDDDDYGMESIVARRYCNSLTIFDANKPEWVSRKAYYKRYLKNDYIGREGARIYGYGSCSGMGRKVAMLNEGVSVFDPVLAECLIRLFSEKADYIIDPFAGGLCRGFVSAEMRRHYLGVDLNERQIKYNIERAKRYKIDNLCKYICGNSLHIDKFVEKDDFDMLLTCPPYFQLEKYTNKPEDLSNYLSYESFIRDLETIIIKASKKVKKGKFIVLVVSNFRDKEGYIIDFVGDVIRFMQRHGYRLYNEGIYINAYATAHLRARMIYRTKKLTKVHQNVLVFRR